MEKLDITLKEVSTVYSGPAGRLWELVMGEQIHIGGWKSSMALAEKAGIRKGMKILDLCSALAGGLRFLVKTHHIKAYGLDGTPYMVAEARRRVKAEKLSKHIQLKLGDVTCIPWPDRSFDVVWGEDAWCYVDAKEKLITEAARVLKRGGVIAFTDWIEGAKGLKNKEAERINRFMKFPYMESMKGYKKLLRDNGFDLKVAEDVTPDFAEHITLYIKMLTGQLTYDALRIIGDDVGLFQAMGAEMSFMEKMAHAGKFGRCRFVASLR